MLWQIRWCESGPRTAGPPSSRTWDLWSLPKEFVRYPETVAGYRIGCCAGPRHYHVVMPPTPAQPILAKVKVSARGAARLKQGLVWVYRSDVVAAESIAPGTL